MEKFTIDSTGAVVDRTIASIGKLHFISEKWTKCCRFDRFVRFVKWKSFLSIRQVRSSIGQLHLISDNGDPFHSRFHIKNLSNRRIHLNDDYKQMYRKSVGDNKQGQAKTRTSLICIPRSLSVSDNMTRVGRKKLTIQGPVWSESVGEKQQ